MSDTTVTVALIVTTGSIITALITGLFGVLTYRQTRDTHRAVNSRMGELLRAAETIARAEGMAAGVAGVTTAIAQAARETK